MFNLKKNDNNKYAMAIGARSIMQGNFSAGALKFRLVEIDDYIPNIQKIKNSINDMYSGDGGNLYFLFAAENTYSKPREVNDKNTLNRMIEEKLVREEFTKAVYLKKISDLTDKEEQEYINESGIISKIVDSLLIDFASQGNSEDDIKIMREIHTNNVNNKIIELKKHFDNIKVGDLEILMELYYDNNDSEMEKIFEPLITDDIEKAANVRITINKSKLENSNISIEDESSEKIKQLYLLYNKSASYHPEVSNRGEISLLNESIEKLNKLINGEENSIYDVNQYIESKIMKIEDAEHRENMEDAWELFKNIRFPLQNPSWVAIGWPQKGADIIPLQGANYGDNLKIKNLSDLTFCDPETDQKYRWHKDVGYITSKNVPSKGSVRSLPVTPQTTLIEVIGRKPAGKTKIIESILQKIQNKKDELGMASTMEKHRQKLQEISNLMKYLSWHMKIRNNLNTVDHTDKKSYYYLYDEICNLYFQYNRERYGDAIMLKSSAFKDEGNRKVIGRNLFNNANQPYRPFIPTALHDDLREVVISVHYAYGTDFPHFASTTLPKNTKFSEELLSKIIQKASEEGITKLTANNDKISEEIIVDPVSLRDFFFKLSQGGVLVQRVEKIQNENNPNIVWYTGMKSYTERYDRKNLTTRTVLGDDGEYMEYYGYGKSRIFSGDATNSKKFKANLRKLSVYNASEGSVIIDDGQAVHIGPSLENVYEYAEKYYGLDYGIDKIKSMVAKKIKPIPDNIFKEMHIEMSQTEASEITRMTNNPKDKKIVIPFKTQEQINQWIEEINRELLTQNKETVIPETKQEENIQQIQTPLNVPEQNRSIPQIETNIQNISYQPNQNDYSELEHLKSLKTIMNGKIALDQKDAEELKRKGYIVTLIEGNEYTIEDPPWSKVIIK